MAQDEYNKVEGPAIAQLQAQGWLYLHGKALTPSSGERGSFRDVVLVRRLQAAIQRLNPWISKEHARNVMREITRPNFAGLMEYNQAIYKLLVSELQSVEQDVGKGRKGQTVHIIDFETPGNNEFLCVNQFQVEGVNNKNIYPDLVCFVNGLPLAVIECKAPASTSPMQEAIKQLRRYANLRKKGWSQDEDEGAEKLFWYNQFMVATSRDKAKVGTISSSAQHYGDWKDAYPFSDAELVAGLHTQQGLFDLTAQDRNPVEDQPDKPYLNRASVEAANTGEDGHQIASITAQQRLLAGLFSRSNFLDLLQNFIIYEVDDGRLIKKVARYQQYRAVNKVIERLKQGKNRKEKSGVVWHTQGSGKSLTMVMLAKKMRRDAQLKQYKLVFITDRKQLDKQLSTTFKGAQGETVHNADSVASLKELLKKDASDLVTAMVQKFQDAEKEDDFSNLNPSENIIVLADEAHRTQFGSLALTINAALPNAPKIGFTGTPLLKSQKMDKAFGGYIDQYKINQAVDDGATVRILYEGRQVKTDVVDQSLDQLFNEYFSDKTEEQKREIKKKYGVERAVREAPARIEWVCIDLLKHYRQHIQPNGFKAMIVVGSRHAATVFKKTLDNLGAPPSEVVISGKHNDEAYIAKYTNKRQQEHIIQAYKKPFGDDPKDNNNTAFIIVADMLLTGFDAPIAQVMYIDRPLKDHTLMQAIARVNRTYKGKQCGFVVDYHGLADALSDAIEQFSSDEVAGTYYSLKDEIPRLKAAHTRVLNCFKDIKERTVERYVLALKSEDLRSQFDIAFKTFAKQLDIILPDTSAKPFIDDAKFFGKVHHSAKNQYRDEGLDISDAGEKVRHLVDNHIISTGVDPKIPPVDLLAANFKESIALNRSEESRASEIESAIKHHITVNLEEDPEYYQSLSLRLRDIIERTEGKWDLQLELLLKMVNTIESERQQTATDLGLSDTELAFYNILIAEVGRLTQTSPTQDSQEIQVQDEEPHQAIIEATKSLVNILNEATQIVDFFNKPDEIKRMKKTIKRTILDSTFGDKAIVPAVQERFMELAKVRFKSHAQAYS